MNKNCIILVCCHKKDPHIKNEGIYSAIQVGKANTDLDLGFLKDNTGNNISDKNGQYNELSALYWGWKNLENFKYLGLCHYRRYFSRKISEDSIPNILTKKDIIVIKPITHTYSNADEFIKLVSFEDLYILLDTLLDLYPDIKDAIVEYCYNSNKWIPCNMFIASKKVTNEYCDFLFRTLFKVESKIKHHNYHRLNRNLGYMGELLLGIYCTYRNLKCHFDEFETNSHITIESRIRSIITEIKYNISFKFSNRREKYTDIPIYESVITGLKQDNIKINHINK